MREAESEPLAGTGPGTFRYWWDRDGDSQGAVQDAHSLYLQTLGELGIVGIALLAGFLVLDARGRHPGRARRRRGPGRAAAALAGCVAFCVTAAVDWVWQIPVLPVAFLLLASSLALARAGPRPEGAPALALPLRIGLSVVAIAAIAAISIPVASTSLVRESEADAREGDLPAALDAAGAAQHAQPSAASPRVQRALVLETAGEPAPAAEAARGATERESTNWRTWLVLSRIEAERGRAEAALAAYRRAKSLNPLYAFFSE